jgi:hypothetical protein
MRALCGAIITAGAMIGLGLLSIGIGIRYSTFQHLNLQGEVQWIRFRDLDNALLVAFVTALILMAIGLGIAFLGLAYHHQRRHLEHMHRMQHPHNPDRPADRVTL